MCAVSGSGEHTFDDTDRDGYSALKEILERNNYKTRVISCSRNRKFRRTARCCWSVVRGSTTCSR